MYREGQSIGEYKENDMAFEFKRDSRQKLNANGSIRRVFAQD